MIYKIIIYSFGDIDNSGLVLACLSLQSCLFWHERPETVQVDGGGELLVSLQAEVSHTLLTEVSGMAIGMVNIMHCFLRTIDSCADSALSWPSHLGCQILTICSCWSSCGACHQPYLYHRDASCACQLYRVRVKRVLSTSWSFSTLQPIGKNIIFNR